jgi:hypothetical protein
MLFRNVGKTVHFHSGSARKIGIDNIRERLKSFNTRSVSEKCRRADATCCHSSSLALLRTQSMGIRGGARTSQERP